MPSNFDQFDRDLKLFAEFIVPEQDFKTFIKKLATETLSRLVIKTPIDTGRAKSNWMVTLNQEPLGFIEIGNLTVQQAIDFSMSRGIPVIESYKPFDTIYIGNNVPYIGKLEFGGSKQAPDGMLRVTIQQIQEIFG